MKYGPAVGKVETRDGTAVLSMGSCFLIDETGLILTNAHVVRDASFNPQRKIIVTFPFGPEPEKEHEARIKKIGTDELDLALLAIEGRFPTFCVLDAKGEPPLMSEILVSGYPLGRNFKSTPGFIQAYQEIEGIGHMLDLSAAVDAGNSGGPVFAKDGRVIGIVTAKITGFNFNLALPIRVASDFIAAEDRQLAVRVVTNPAGARVFINGIYRGVSPLEIGLYNRDYALVLEKEGYVTVEKTISPPGEGKSEIKIDMAIAVDPSAAVLTITTTPPGAQLVIDNTDRGTTPVVINATKGSRLRIRLSLRGYKDFYTEVTLGDESSQILTFSLQKAGLFW
jgi:hypothetical protein